MASPNFGGQKPDHLPQASEPQRHCPPSFVSIKSLQCAVRIRLPYPNSCNTRASHSLDVARYIKLSHKVKCYLHFTDQKLRQIFSNLVTIVQIKARQGTKLSHLQAKAVAFITGPSFFMTLPCSKSTNCFKRTTFLYELSALVTKDQHKRDNGLRHYCPRPFH